MMLFWRQTMITGVYVVASAVQELIFPRIFAMRRNASSGYVTVELLRINTHQLAQQIH